MRARAAVAHVLTIADCSLANGHKTSPKERSPERPIGAPKNRTRRSEKSPPITDQPPAKMATAKMGKLSESTWRKRGVIM